MKPVPRLLLATMLCAASSALAIDQTINQQIWKMKYGVTDAQLASGSWLSADDDADGASNGAEIAAGTDPFRAASIIRIATVTLTPTAVELTFPTVAGKRYVAQRSADLTNGAGWTAVSGAQLIGDGNPKLLSAPRAVGPFYRVAVEDRDTDGDEVSDWAEIVAGLRSE